MRAVWARLVEGCWWRRYWCLRRFLYFLNVIKLYGLFYFVQLMFAFCRSCTAHLGSAGHRLDGVARSGLDAAGRTAGTGRPAWVATSANPRGGPARCGRRRSTATSRPATKWRHGFLSLPRSTAATCAEATQTRRNTSVPLVPPKPKLFLIATSIFMSRAVLAQ